MIRFHPNVDNTFFNNTDKRLINVTDYPNPQDLMFVADIMISDYSSAPIDFLLLNRVVFLYLPDFKEYQGDKNPFFEVFKVSKTKGIALDPFDEIIGRFQFGVRIV
ncbi:Glycero-transferase [Streptococcus pneumoniae]|nr:Glycero-transferase [Streptococcus pneumoniae]CAG6302640.1 Glycero-transferase [Streptococcus pneumoniae]